jgi:Tol biopolymer transport system component
VDYNLRMKTRIIIAVITLVLLVLVGMVALAWLMRPRLMDVHPTAGAEAVPVTAQISLEFSRPMNEESVVKHLKIEPAIEGEYSWDQNMLLFIPKQSWPSGQMIKVNLEEGARAQSWLAFPMKAESWSFITRQAYLAYLWPSDGPADIYALNPTSGEIHQFTHRMGVLEFTSSNDGITLFFSASNSQGGSDLYQLDMIEETNSTDDTYAPTKLLHCGAAQCRAPAISYEGLTLAYEYLLPDPKGGLGSAQIHLLNLMDKAIKPIGQATHETVQPGWSSKGWLAYYDRTSQAYEVVDPELQNRIQLINQTGQPGNWSFDGQFYLAPEIMYYPSSGDTETGISHLLQYSLAEEKSGDLSKEDNVEDVEGTYSPNGLLIAFSRKYLDMERWTFGRQLWIMNPDGTNAHAITDEPYYNHFDLAWSWDSQMLAYVRFNEAQLFEPPELWMINADGSHPIQLIIGGYAPLWIP